MNGQRSGASGPSALLAWLLLAHSALAQSPSPAPPPPLGKTPAALSFNYTSHWAKYADALRLGDAARAQVHHGEFLKALRRYRVARSGGVIQPDQPGCSGCVGYDEPPIDGIAPLSGSITELPVPAPAASVTPVPPPHSTFLETISSVSREAATDFAREATEDPAQAYNLQIVTPTGQATTLQPADEGATRLGLDVNVDSEGNPLPPPFTGVAPVPEPSAVPSFWGPSSPPGLGY